jgi:CubicO group peptidase (beta-lactamase class C family)
MAVGLLLQVPTLSADPAAATESYIRTQMREQGIPGVALGVVRHGRPIYLQGFGVATLEHAVPVRPQTRFQIGSIGKQFTAVAVMLLAQEGRLSLDDPLAKYLAEIPPGWRGVTLRLMLNHQAGIPQLTPPDHNLLDLHHDYSDEEYVRLATSLPLDFEPGTDVAYSDTAYVLLGFVIGRVAHEFYGDLLAKRVFRPLRMQRTRIVSDADIIPGRASGYERDVGGRLRNQDYVSPSLNRTADGSLYSTVVDLARWDAALYGERVLPQADLRRMWSIDPHRDGSRPLLHYGYGWEINSLRGHAVIEYDGNWQGFQAALARYPDRGLTVIVLTNLALCRAQRLAHTVAGIFDPQLAGYPQTAADAAPQRTARFRALLDTIRGGGVDPEPFSPSARARFSEHWARSLGRDLAAVGAIRSVRLVEQDASGRERIYRVEAERMIDYFTVRDDPAGLIEDIDLSHEY